MGNAALDCTGQRHIDSRSIDIGQQKGKYLVEVAASVLFGIPPLATAYHTSILVEGEEYFFSDSGMCADTNLISHQGNPSEKWEAGRTDFSGSDLWRALGEHFRPGTYDLLRKNCNSFTDAAMFFLLRKRLDKRYSEAERIGQNTPEVVRALGMYAPNPVADSFSLEGVVDALEKLNMKPSRAAASPPKAPNDYVSHRIPHLPRASTQRKVLSDLSNLQGPGARASEAEAVMMKKTFSRLSEDSTSSTNTSNSRRPAPRKFASTATTGAAPNRPATPPRQAPSMPSQSAVARPVTPRAATRDADKFLTQRVYPTNPTAPGCEKENLTPRFGNQATQGTTTEKRRSRSKGPISRNIRNTLCNVLASRGGA